MRPSWLNIWGFKSPSALSTISRAIVLAGVCLGATPAFAADPVDEQKVNALFAEARAAFVAGDYATACPKFEEVVRLKPGLGARLGLGDCYRAQVRLAKAWEVYRAVLDDVPELVKKAKGFAEQSKVRKRGDEANARLEEIEPKLGWVVLVVPQAVLDLKDVVVHLDGVAVDRAKLGVRVPVDRGDHAVDVSAPGKKTWNKTVALGEGAEFSVTVQPLEDDVPPVKPGPTEPPPPTGNDIKPPPNVITPPPIGDNKPPPDIVHPPLPGDMQNQFFSPQRILGLSLGVVGVGGVIAGAAFGGRAIQKRDESLEGGHCTDDNRCDKIGLPLRQASYDAGNASTLLLIGGGLAAAAGAVIFLTAPKKALPVQATFVVGPSGLYCLGRF